MVDEKKEPEFLKNNISNIDIYVLACELDQTLREGFIHNIYEVGSSEILIIKCRTKDGKKSVIIDPKKRINITEFEYPVPAFPSQFILSMRKYMKGRRIERVYQYKMDRIIIIQLKSSEGNPWLFIVEFFGGGNYILVNGEGLVHMAKSYKKLKDRDVLAKRPYDYPQSRGIDLFDLTADKIQASLKDAQGELVRILARSFNIGGYLAEEICAQAEIDKKTDVKALTDSQRLSVQAATLNLVQSFSSKTFSPQNLYDNGNNLISFEPFSFQIYSQYRSVPKPDFNHAVDEFFSKIDATSFSIENLQESSAELTKSEKILNKQVEKIQDSEVQRKESLEQGHLIYQYLNEIDTLLATIMSKKRETKLSWEEITVVVEKGKAQNIPECMIFDKILEKELKLQINLQGTIFKLDLKKTAIENAQEIYGHAKKAKKKIEGAKIALENTKKKIIDQKVHVEEAESNRSKLIKRPPAKWYEKYRWFFSTDGFLIVGGRDASSNETIVKKHMKKGDLFFHTDVHGASVCVIQNPDQKGIPENTLTETAIFAAAYSSAWKQGSAEIFYVQPDQVSKTPKSGEYLSKGSFYITGKKEFLPKPYLGIVIGVKLIPMRENELSESTDQESEEESAEEGTPEESNLETQDAQETEPDVEIQAKINDTTQKESGEGSFQASQPPESEGDESNQELMPYYPQVFAGPLIAVKKQTEIYVLIKPSKSERSTSDLAKKILKLFVDKSPEPLKPWVKMASINDIIRYIPAGGSEVAEKVK